MRTPIKPVAPDAKIVMKDYKKDKAMKYGHEYIEPTTPQWFTSYPYMIVIMAVLQVMTVLYGIKMFMFFGFDVSVGWLITMPCVLYIFQITAECYGWQYARQIIWLNFLTNMIVTVCMVAFKFIPFTGYNPTAVQSGYINLLDNNIIYFAPTMWLGMFFADYITSSLMCWSRFHWNGKFLLIRIAILHVISEIIMLSGGFIAGTLSGVSLSIIWHFSIDSFLARSIVMLALLPVAKLIIWFIQHKVEGVIVFDLHSTFNPFRFKINPNDSLQFSVSGKHETNVGVIDMKKLAQAYSKVMLEEQQQKQTDEFNNSINKTAPNIP